MTIKRRRNSLRLKGFDYSEPAGYFVTICTYERRCVLGEVAGGRMILSDEGKVVENSWKQIPDHFENTNVDVFQIMPNHVHGIIDIKEPNHTIIGRGEVSSPTETLKKGDGTSPLRKAALGRMVAYFKYETTKRINVLNRTPGKKLFQRNFHDHIIRDDIDRFFIEQYIELNPVLWELDRENPAEKEITMDALRTELQKRDRLGMGEKALPLREWIVEYEMNYRSLQKVESESSGITALLATPRPLQSH